MESRINELRRRAMARGGEDMKETTPGIKTSNKIIIGVIVAIVVIVIIIVVAVHMTKSSFDLQWVKRYYGKFY